PNPRERQRLLRLQCPHSGAWVTAVPSTLDGNDTVMNPRNFQVAVLVRLGLPVLSEEVSCSLCMQTIDVFGNHAACCTKNADLIHRHNRVRNLVDRFCSEGGLSSVMEKKGILGNSDKPGRRPGDVTISNWAKGRGLQLMWQSPVLSPSTTSPVPPLASIMQSPRSTLSMMRTSRARSLPLRPWCSSLLVELMMKVSVYFVSCFALLLSVRQ